MDIQASVSSSTSTVPLDLIHDQDNDFVDYRLSCMEMDKSELDLIIKVQLFAHRNNSTGVDAKKHKDKERENNATIFFQWSPDM